MHYIQIALASLLTASAEAVYMQSSLSFLIDKRAHDDHSSTIPHWRLQGHPYSPDLYSDKVILTQPWGGNHRGAAWTENLLEHAVWTVDVDFRATGPEHGGGNMQIWYVREGEKEIGTASIYTAGKFDGLGIVIDQYAGSGGFVRGFLNDGTKDYKNHHAVDSLAFGHCQYSYRNLGIPSRLTIQQTATNFKVTIGGKTCFESPKIKLPLGYSLGISAASASEPDSFEIMKFAVTTEKLHPETHGIPDPPPAHPEKDEHYPSFISQSERKAEEIKKSASGGSGSDKFEDQKWADLPEQEASKIDHGAQFADLHNRLQGLTRHLITTSRDLVHYQNLAAERHNIILDLLHSLEHNTSPIPALQGQLARFENMERKMDSIVSDVKQTKSDLHSALDQHVAGLRSEVRATHSNVMGTVRGGAIGIGKFVVVVVGSQALTVGAYLLYKKRKAGKHGKYL